MFLSTSRRYTVAITIIATLCLFGLYCQLQTVDSVLETDQEKVMTSSHSCILSANVQPRKSTSYPIWVASYPGSGAELFRGLVTSLTNQPTVDSAMSGDCKIGAVTCKTHWPTMNARFPNPALSRHWFQRNPPYNQNVILLIRNPAKAIPSWFNQIHESRTGARFHSEQAPVQSWKKWSRRYREVETRFLHWRDFILYWLESSYYTVDLIVPFEQITNATMGPELLSQVESTLNRSQVVTVVEEPHKSESVECLWKHTVQQEAKMKRGSHTYVPSYKSKHKKFMLQRMDEFIDWVSYREDLVSVLKLYRRQIAENLVTED